MRSRISSLLLPPSFKLSQFLKCSAQLFSLDRLILIISLFICARARTTQTEELRSISANKEEVKITLSQYSLPLHLLFP